MVDLDTRVLGFIKNNQPGERRVFTPEFFSHFTLFPNRFYLEEGYGTGLGFKHEDYVAANPNIFFSPRDDVLESSDAVLALKAPSARDLNMMKQGASLISMLHFETQKERNILLQELGIIAFSMDSMTLDPGPGEAYGNRYVFDPYGTAFGGMKAGLDEYKKMHEADSKLHPEVVILGLGQVGSNAVMALSHIVSNDSDISGFKQIGYDWKDLDPENISYEDTIRTIKGADIVVDATKRRDTTQYLFDTEIVKTLNPNVIIVDLTADPIDASSGQVKGIYGIPGVGDLEKHVFYPKQDAASFDEFGIPAEYRRICVSCNAWPGTQPLKSSRFYDESMVEMTRILLEKGPDAINESSHDKFERMLARSSLSYFLEHGKYCQ